eukprot:2677180-Prymnesium_polylepis.1
MLPLERAHPHERDVKIVFHEETHTYTVTRGCVSECVPVSVTKFAAGYFKQFDTVAVIEKHYAGWKDNASKLYYPLIHSILQTGGTDADAKIAITS